MAVLEPAQSGQDLPPGFDVANGVQPTLESLRLADYERI